MKHLPLLLIAALGFAAEDAPRRNFRPEQAPEGRANQAPNPRLPVPLSPDEQKRLHEAMQKANQDPAVKEARELAAKAQQAAAEAQKKAHEATEEAARKADPEVAPILEKIRKAMEKRQPNQNGRQPEAQPRGDEGNRQPNSEPGRFREGDRQPEGQPRGEAPRQREGNREQPNNRVGQLPGLTPDEQQRVREAMAKANAEPAVKEAREAAAAAQRKAMEIAEDAARKADPSIAPLLEKMRKAGANRRPEGQGQPGRKQPE
jgi:colicin import membrane protein